MRNHSDFPSPGAFLLVWFLMLLAGIAFWGGVLYLAYRLVLILEGMS